MSGSPTTGLGGQGYFAPRRPTMSQTKKRRRDILVGLLGATGVTFLGMLVLGGMVTYLFGLSLVLTVAYVMALANLQKRAIERRSKVRYLDGTAVAPAAWAGPEWTPPTTRAPSTPTRRGRSTPSAAADPRRVVPDERGHHGSRGRPPGRAGRRRRRCPGPPGRRQRRP